MDLERVNQKYLKRDIIHRAIELLAVEAIISVIIAVLVKAEVIPSTSNGLIVLGAGLLLYLIFVAHNCYEYFWVVNDKRTYFKASLIAYVPVIVLSIFFRYFTSLFTWMFFPMKIFMVLPVGRTGSVLISHLLVLAVIVFIGLFFIPLPANEDEEI